MTLFGATMRSAAISLPLLFTSPSFAGDGDPAAGKIVFGRCTVCHVAESETNAVGPNLFGIRGRQVAAAEKFEYSPAMRAFAQGGRTWDDVTLTLFIKAPRQTVPGTKMAFAGLKNEADVSNLLAYFESLQR
ncbi:cytochrome c family protein (plasmid) [Sinorhizobium chiapasense]|uniref:c-type cytochrome n=1 Tax=Sinorhizobium chiapasense TaxID=501572 RepID=UPI002FE3B172